MLAVGLAQRLGQASSRAARERGRAADDVQFPLLVPPEDQGLGMRATPGHGAGHEFERVAMPHLQPFPAAARIFLVDALGDDAFDPCDSEVLEPFAGDLDAAGRGAESKCGVPSFSQFFEQQAANVIGMPAQVASGDRDEVEGDIGDRLLIDETTDRAARGGESPLQGIEIQTVVGPAHDFAVDRATGWDHPCCSRGDIGERLGEILALPRPQ
jgi:hypothetical protein